MSGRHSVSAKRERFTADGEQHIYASGSIEHTPKTSALIKRSETGKNRAHILHREHSAPPVRAKQKNIRCGKN